MIFRPSFAQQFRMRLKDIEKRFATQPDPLYHYYLICAAIITASITAIKCVVPGMRFPLRLIISLVSAIIIIVISLAYIAMRRLKIGYGLRIFIWLSISITLVTCASIDLIWVCIQRKILHNF